MGLRAASLFAVLGLPLAPSAADTAGGGVGFWNGYLRQANVVECVNLASSAASGTVSFRDGPATTRGTLPLTIPPWGTTHFAVEATPGRAAFENVYGTYRVDASGSVSCVTVFYRFEAADYTSPLEYAFALPQREPWTGPSHGRFNPMNPVPAAGAVGNWLTVYNAGDAPFDGTVEVFRQDGAPDPDAGFAVQSLAAGERRDFSLNRGSRRVGLYSITPAREGSPYLAFVARYSPGSNGHFQFAVPLWSQAGTCDLDPPPPPP